MPIDWGYTPGAANSLAASYNASVENRNLLAQQAAAAKAAQLGYDVQSNAFGQTKATQDVVKNYDINTPEGLSQLYRVNPAAAREQAKAIDERRKSKTENFKTTLGMIKEVAQGINAAPTYLNAKAQLARLEAATGEDLSADRAQLDAIGDNPALIKEWAMRHALDVEKQLGKITEANLNDRTAILSSDPVTGVTREVGSYKRGMTGYEQGMLEDRRKSRDIEERRLQAENENRVPKDDPTKVVANTITDSAGNVTQYNKFGAKIGETKIGIGKPSATYEKTKALEAQTSKNLDQAITELEAVTKPGGLIEQSTGSGIGRGIDAAASFFGSATPGAIAIGKLKPIADMSLKMVPRFEGPQSDKDTQSYKEAAGQLADSSLPTEIRLAAGKEVLRLMKSRRAQFVSSEMAAEGLTPNGVDSTNPLLK